jgi:hypothetical protein
MAFASRQRAAILSDIIINENLKILQINYLAWKVNVLFSFPSRSHCTCNKPYGDTRYIIFVMIHNFSYSFKLFQIQDILNPNTVPEYLDQGLNSSKSRTGLSQWRVVWNVIKLDLNPSASHVQIYCRMEKKIVNFWCGSKAEECGRSF